MTKKQQAKNDESEKFAKDVVRAFIMVLSTMDRDFDNAAYVILRSVPGEGGKAIQYLYSSVGIPSTISLLNEALERSKEKLTHC